MTRHLVYLDVETTGLDPRLHAITEIAYAVGDGPIVTVLPRHHLRHASPQALEVSRYWERDLLNRANGVGIDDLLQVLTDATVVGANPAFDTGMLLKTLGYAPWHYRLLDVEAFGAGVLGLDFVPSLSWLQGRLTDDGAEGIPKPDHTAAGDVATLRAVHHALTRSVVTS